MPDAIFACPDLTTFARLDELSLEVVGQRLEPDRAVLACRGRDGVVESLVGRGHAADPTNTRGGPAPRKSTS